MLNTQESPEYRKLVNEYNIGFNCNNNDPNNLADKLILLYDKLRKRCNNNRKLAETKFDRQQTYSTIIELIKGS